MNGEAKTNGVNGDHATDGVNDLSGSSTHDAPYDKEVRHPAILTV